MKRPLAFLILIIALAWLLHAVDISMTGATTNIEPVCGNHLCELGEDYNSCSDDCTHPICGNNVVEKECSNDTTKLYCEECDGIDDSLCPELCQFDCKCPPPIYRNYTLLPNRYTFAYDSLKQNELVTITLDRPKAAFQSANFITSDELKSVRFIADVNFSAPAQAPSGIVNSYFKISMENSSQEQSIAYIEIFFKVPTSWTIANNIKEVELQTEGTTWKSVETKKLYQDLNYIYLAARPQKLGLFAIVSPIQVTLHPVCGNGAIETGETSQTCCADAGCPKNQSCIANTCKFVAICGNNLCEPTENASICPADCALVKFRPSTAPALIILGVILAAILFFFYRKLPKLYTKKLKPTEHATPERWF